VLCCRNVRVLVSDRFSLGSAVLQAPLLAALTLLAFNGFKTDDSAANYFCRTVHYFHKFKAPYEARGDTPPYNQIIADTKSAVARETRLISVSAAQRRAALYFVLISATIWIGILGSCRDIVAEKDVLFRELRTCSRIGPCLLAKFSVQVVLVGLQTAAIAAMVYPVLLAHGQRSGLILWGVMWLAGCAAVCLGLLLSSLSPNIRAALTLVPLLMVPQLLLGGLLRPPAQASVESPLRTCFEHLTLQRWGFEAAVATDRYVAGGVVAVELARWGTPTRCGELAQLKPTERNIHSLFFNDAAPESLLARLAPAALGKSGPPVVMLAVLSGVLLLLAYAAVRIRFLAA
jgi:hypothetical protein